MKVYSFTNNKQTEVPLKAHVVYDVATGKILHRHWTFANDVRGLDKEKLFSFVRADLRAPHMEALTVEGGMMHRDKKYRVDVEKRILQEAESL